MVSKCFGTSVTLACFGLEVWNGGARAVLREAEVRERARTEVAVVLAQYKQEMHMGGGDRYARVSVSIPWRHVNQAAKEIARTAIDSTERPDSFPHPSRSALMPLQAVLPVLPQNVESIYRYLGGPVRAEED